MINFANSVDCYQIWADMVCFDEVRNLDLNGPHYYCVYAGRRDGVQYLHTHEQIMTRYGSRMKMCDRLPDALALDMGNQMYVINAVTEKERDNFIRFVQQRV